MHGGWLRLTCEYGIEKIVRDLRVHQILEGTNEIMRVIVARALIGGPLMDEVIVETAGQPGAHPPQPAEGPERPEP